MNGSGEFQYVSLENELIEIDNWDDFPEAMKTLVKFLPDFPRSPHTQEEHDYIESFVPMMKEVMRRCQR